MDVIKKRKRKKVEGRSTDYKYEADDNDKCGKSSNDIIQNHSNDKWRLFTLLQSNSPAVQYEAAGMLLIKNLKTILLDRSHLIPFY